MNEQILSSVSITSHTTQALGLQLKAPNPYPELCSHSTWWPSRNHMLREAREGRLLASVRDSPPQ